MHLAMLHLPRAEDRVVAVFADLAERFGRVTTEGVLIDLPLTHEMIGGLIGGRRPTVTLAVRSLAAQGLLSESTTTAGNSTPGSFPPKSSCRLPLLEPARSSPSRHRALLVLGTDAPLLALAGCLGRERPATITSAIAGGADRRGNGEVHHVTEGYRDSVDEDAIVVIARVVKFAGSRRGTGHTANPGSLGRLQLDPEVAELGAGANVFKEDQELRVAIVHTDRLYPMVAGERTNASWWFVTNSRSVQDRPAARSSLTQTALYASDDLRRASLAPRLGVRMRAWVVADAGTPIAGMWRSRGSPRRAMRKVNEWESP